VKADLNGISQRHTILRVLRTAPFTLPGIIGPAWTGENRIYRGECSPKTVVAQANADQTMNAVNIMNIAERMGCIN